MQLRHTKTALATITVLAGAATIASSTGSGIPAQLPICYTTAVLAYTSDYKTIESEFWLDYAKCLNDTEEDLATCLMAEYQEALGQQKLALDQFKARIDLCFWLGDGAYDPDYDDDDFSADVDAEYFPLIPGRTLIYQKNTSNGVERVEISTLDDTFEVDDVECRVVHDVVTLDGELVEDTFDWFAQEEDGDVWYFGEIAVNYEDGMISDVDGSWRAGTDGAKAGIQMREDPVVGDTYRQEFLLGEAEDVARVVNVGVTVHTPAGTFTNCIETEDFSPLEPGKTERKFYAPCVGLVRELNPVTGAKLDLIQIVGP